MGEKNAYDKISNSLCDMVAILVLVTQTKKEVHTKAQSKITSCHSVKVWLAYGKRNVLDAVFLF